MILEDLGKECWCGFGYCGTKVAFIVAESIVVWDEKGFGCGGGGGEERGCEGWIGGEEIGELGELGVGRYSGEEALCLHVAHGEETGQNFEE